MIRYKQIEGKPAECRVTQLYSGDELYLNVAMMKDLGFERELQLGETVSFPIKVQVTKRYTHKKYPNKKWWQFWLKQEEYVDGYNLMIM